MGKYLVWWGKGSDNGSSKSDTPQTGGGYQEGGEGGRGDVIVRGKG